VDADDQRIAHGVASGESTCSVFPERCARSRRPATPAFAACEPPKSRRTMTAALAPRAPSPSAERRRASTACQPSRFKRGRSLESKLSFSVALRHRVLRCRHRAGVHRRRQRTGWLRRHQPGHRRPDGARRGITDPGSSMPGVFRMRRRARWVSSSNGTDTAVLYAFNPG
jgi:hypothetical protein